jgi:hypothetical protein
MGWLASSKPPQEDMAASGVLRYCVDWPNTKWATGRSRTEVFIYTGPKLRQPHRGTTFVGSKIMILVLFAGAILAIAGFIIFALRTMGF